MRAVAVCGRGHGYFQTRPLPQTPMSPSDQITHTRHQPWLPSGTLFGNHRDAEQHSTNRCQRNPPRHRINSSPNLHHEHENNFNWQHYEANQEWCDQPEPSRQCRGSERRPHRISLESFHLCEPEAAPECPREREPGQPAARPAAAEACKHRGAEIPSSRGAGLVLRTAHGERRGEALPP